MVYVHRLAYEMSTGEQIGDDLQIDHLCHNRLCCNPAHLRTVTNKQNSEHLRGAYRNSRSGVRGVRQSKNGRRWLAEVRHNGEHFHLGVYDTTEEADEAVRLKRIELFTHNDLDRR